MSRAKLDEIIVVAADRTSGLTNGLDLDARDRRQSARKELILDFARDGNFVFETLALVLLLDEPADGTGHLIEGFAELAELVAALDLHAMREVSHLHVL